MSDATRHRQPLYVGTAHAKWPVIAAAGFLGLGYLIASTGPEWAGMLIAVVGVTFLPFTTATLTVDGEEVSVRFMFFPFPVTISRDRIETAEVIDLKPLKWGGWGYRGLLTIMNRAAIVIRGGEAVLLHLKDGKQFAITVDNAQGAVDALA